MVFVVDVVILGGLGSTQYCSASHLRLLETPTHGPLLNPAPDTEAPTLDATLVPPLEPRWYPKRKFCMLFGSKERDERERMQDQELHLHGVCGVLDSSPRVAAPKWHVALKQVDYRTCWKLTSKAMLYKEPGCQEETTKAPAMSCL